MPKTTVLDNSFATLWYYPEDRIIHHQLKKFTYGDTLHQILSEGLKLAQQNHATKWLSDDRLNTVLSKEDAEWGITNWIQPMVNAGWKYWAIVQPEKVIAQMNMGKLAKDYAALGITAKFFSAPDDALRWLKSQ